MMTFLSVPPDATRNTASESPPSDCPVHVSPRSYLYMPPSNDDTVVAADSTE